MNLQNLSQSDHHILGCLQRNVCLQTYTVYLSSFGQLVPMVQASLTFWYESTFWVILPSSSSVTWPYCEGSLGSRWNLFTSVLIAVVRQCVIGKI